MTPLNRTFSFKQMPAVSLRIAYELKFDVPDTLKVFFYKQCCLAKSCARLCGRHFELLSQLLFIVSKSNASASTSKGRLEQNRVAGFVSNISRFVHIFNNAIASRHCWNFGLFHDSFAFHLVASKFHSFASWPDKDDTIFFAHLRKVLILGEKAVAGVNGICSRLLGSLHYLGHIEVTLSWRCRTDVVGFISSLYMRCADILVRVNCY